MEPDKIKVRWLRPCPGWAYHNGDISELNPHQVESIKSMYETEISNIKHKAQYPKDDGPYIEILPYGWAEPVITDSDQEKEFVDVLWLEPCKGFAYSQGDTGKVLSDDLPALLLGNYVKIVKSPGESKSSILGKLKSVIK